jgi:hypothetical protein
MHILNFYINIKRQNFQDFLLFKNSSNLNVKNGDKKRKLKERKHAHTYNTLLMPYHCLCYIMYSNPTSLLTWHWKQSFSPSLFYIISEQRNEVYPFEIIWFRCKLPHVFVLSTIHRDDITVVKISTGRAMVLKVWSTWADRIVHLKICQRTV